MSNSDTSQNIIANAELYYTTKTEYTDSLNLKSDVDHNHDTIYYTIDEIMKKYVIV